MGHHNCLPNDLAEFDSVEGIPPQEEQQAFKAVKSLEHVGLHHTIWLCLPKIRTFAFFGEVNSVLLTHLD